MTRILHKELKNGLGVITLNRPEAINALNLDMLVEIDRILRKWETSKTINAVLIKGAGEKGFCAGGDVKSFYYGQNDPEKQKAAQDFFTFEYQLDDYIHHYQKPIVAIMDGVCMGGGIGLINGVPIRIATERTKWAMPEVHISLFPDTGGGYFLNQCPGHIGRYLALTGIAINAADALFAKVATHFLPSSQLPLLVEKLEETDFHHDAHISLKTAVEELAQKPDFDGKLEGNLKEIDAYFHFETVEEILEALENADTLFAKETFSAISSKSPLALKVTLKLLVDSIGKTYSQVLETDLILAKNFLSVPDFYEGLRSVLVEKDRKPVYFYKDLEQVTQEDIERIFSQS